MYYRLLKVTDLIHMAAKVLFVVSFFLESNMIRPMRRCAALKGFCTEGRVPNPARRDSLLRGAELGAQR